MAKKEPPTTGTNSDFASTFGEIRVEMLFVLSCIVDIERGVWEREREGEGEGRREGEGFVRPKWPCLYGGVIKSTRLS